MARGRKITLKERLDSPGGEETATRVQLVVSGPSASRVYDLAHSEIALVGRSPDVRISVDDPMISRVHAQVERKDDGVFVQDRGSSNGTWYNGRRVESKFMIRPGEEVKIGSTVLSIVVTSPLPDARRKPMAADELMTRLGYELERAELKGIPLGLIVIHPRAMGIPADLVSSRLRDLMGPGDMIGWGRRSEVIALLPEGTRQRAEAIVQKFIELTTQTASPAGGIGIAMFPDDGEEPDELIESALESSKQESWRATIPPQRPSTDGRKLDTKVSGVSEEPDSDAEVIVKDLTMRNVVKSARKVAGADVPVLITGETGVGKEVLARYIHDSGHRSTGPFIKVNCASLPPSVIEAELFGHEKGGFTGAQDRRKGYLEAAEGGTIVLDEITELPPAIQVKLLRFLDDLTINRVGSTQEIRINTRVIALSNRDVDEEVREGRFRRDLYFRLSTYVLLVPPLRGRPEDIPVLAEYFARRMSQRLDIEPPSFGEGFLEKLQAHSWSGNVRELKNAVEGSIIRAEGETLEIRHLPDDMTSVEAGEDASGIRGAREDAEIQEIRRALAATGGNQTAAAAILGVTRRTLWAKLKKYGIEP
jgi:DNA-binding NtrC family response regulator